MPQTNNLLTLNNYDYSDTHLDAVKEYLKTGDIPADFTPQQRRVFIRRYDSERFKVDNDKLIFTPLRLECVPESKKETILKEMYDDIAVSPGLGIVGFYNKITQLYLGIKRNDVRDFLGRQETYQITKSKRPSINKTIIAKHPNQRWQIDLLDVSTYSGHNRKRKYILTGIDVFSRFVFACGIVNKMPKTIVKLLNIFTVFKVMYILSFSNQIMARNSKTRK